MTKSVIFGLLLFAISGCEDFFFDDDNEPPFTVTVLSEEGEPVEGAILEGGFDWDHFRVETDQEGMATVPGCGLGESTSIFKNNYFPTLVSELSPDTFTIIETPMELRELGPIEGDETVRFTADTLITMTYQGEYHFYLYDDEEINEIASAQLPSTARDIQTCGDTLWFKTHDEGIYVYSLEDPLAPREVCHLKIPGCLGPFAVRDSIVVVSEPYDIRMVRIYVYDLEEPAAPTLVYEGEEPAYESGILFGDRLVLCPSTYWYDPSPENLLLDLSDPPNPVLAGEFFADSWLSRIVDERTAIGTYCPHSESVSVMDGWFTDSFETMAIIYESIIYGPITFVDGRYPFFAIGGRFCRLGYR